LALALFGVNTNRVVIQYGGWFKGAYNYSYNQAGRVINQGFSLSALSPSSNVSFSLSAQYGWDQEGRLISLGGSGGSFTYAYDAMGRLSSMASGGTTIATASYNQADEPTALTYDSFSETRAYDPLMLQLTRITTQQSPSTIMDLSYAYPAGQNNGRISQSTDWVLGETVNYGYDSLNRLMSAQATNNSWGNSYSYDGFGNLTAKAVTAGSAPNFSASYNAGTNQIVGGSYDANGNDISAGRVYDMENRLAQVTDSGQAYPQWGYDPWGERIVEQGYCHAGGADCLLIHLYSITGQKLATSQASAVPNLTQSGNVLYGYQAAPTANVYFGGKLIRAEGVTVATDRLGSVRANASGTQIRYFPYGEERTSTPDNTEKFGTYFKDPGGMYYADQRHYNYIQGRFLTADPAGLAAVDQTNPTTHNGYTYVNADPINQVDPTGTTCIAIGGYWASADMYGCAFLGQPVINPYTPSAGDTTDSSNAPPVDLAVRTVVTLTPPVTPPSVSPALAPIDPFPARPGTFSPDVSGGYPGSKGKDVNKALCYLFTGLGGYIWSLGGFVPIFGAHLAAGGGIIATTAALACM
jgi:RHS repeat-associated protein